MAALETKKKIINSKTTDGSRILHTLLVKHYNVLLHRQGSERSRDEVTYFLGLSMLTKSFLCNTQSLKLFPRNLREDFFFKIGILSPKVYTNNVPNIEVCNFILAPLRTLPIKQVIVVLYYLIGCVKFCTRLYVQGSEQLLAGHFKVLQKL